MSTEPIEEVVPAETKNPAPATDTKPEVVDPETAETKPPEKEETPEDKAARTLRRMERRIDRISAAKYEAIARADAAEARARQLEAKPEDAGADRVDPVELAKEIAKVERVTEKANTIAKDGEGRFPDFKEALNAVIEEAGPLFDRQGRPNPLGDAVMESEDPAALIHFLGKNPDVASELEGLSPAQLGRRLAKIESQMTSKAGKPVSKAADPIKPLNATNQGHKSLETSSFDEYKALRAKQGARWAR